MTAPTAPVSRQRFAIIDVSRGVLILLMMVGHTITFTYQGLNPVLRGISSLADLVCFSGLLLLSGMSGYISYVHEQHSTLSVMNRILKRLNIYILGYWLIAILGYVRQAPLNLEVVWKIISFQILVPYTEFIPAFILFALIKLLGRPFIRHVTHTPHFLFITSAISYLLGLLLHTAPLGFPTAWQALLVGNPGSYSFPVFYYLPVFLVGLFLGYRLYSHGNKPLLKPLTLLLGSSVTLLTGAGLFIFVFPSIIAIFNRWPPTIPFLALSLIGVLLVLILGLKTKILTQFPDMFALLTVCGQNAFALFFTHTLLMFLYDTFNFTPMHNSLGVLVLIISSVGLAMYLAKILPLNYSFGLTVYAIFEDGHVSKTEEHLLSRNIKSFIRALTSVSSLLAVRVRGRQVRLLSVKSISLASLILVLSNTPLGTAEESLLLSRIVENNPPSLQRTWFLATETSATFSINLPQELSPQAVTVQAVIDRNSRYDFVLANDSLQATIPIAGLGVGSHSVEYEFKANKVSHTTSAEQFFISQPLYVSWTIDWEGYSTPNAYLDALEKFSTDYAVPMTHLFNPRIYHTGEVTTERAEYESQWVKTRLTKGDDFGLHLHMHPDFIASASVTPRTEPVWGGGFSPGYDVLTTAYSYEEMVKILEFAKSALTDHGFPEPKLYRAGAWFADTSTLRALQDTGFLADTSGRTNYHFGTNKVPGFWALESTTQPYYPSTSNQNSSSPLPRFSILEIPNNGADSYWFTDAELIKRTQDNFLGVVLNQPTQITFLTHPHWFDPKEQKRVENLFNYLKSIHYEYGHGPVIFVGLSQIYEAFK